MTLNPARLARFADWARTLHPRPLPRTVIPVPGEFHLDYLRRLAHANHLEFLHLSTFLETPGARPPGVHSWQQHRQQRLAAVAHQSLARIARLCWPDSGDYSRDPGSFRRSLRPACRRCTARRGIGEPVLAQLPPHLTICRRHRLWIGPSARTHTDQLDVSPFPEILDAQRRHLALLRDHRSSTVNAVLGDASRSIHQSLSPGVAAWHPRQLRRLRHLDPELGRTADLQTPVGRGYDPVRRPAVDIAIYPDVVRLATTELRAQAAQWTRGSNLDGQYTATTPRKTGTAR